MVQTSRGLRLIHKAHAEFCFLFPILPPHGNGLHRDQTVDLRISGLVHHTHGSAAQFSHDLVPAKPLYLGILHVVLACSQIQPRNGRGSYMLAPSAP